MTGQTVGRIWSQIELILHGHLLNPFWHNRDQRRKKRYKATFESAMGYLRRYAPAIKTINPEPVTTPDEPERAFTIWFQGEDNAPEVVKACFRSMRRHLKQELVVLDKKNIFDWITLPNHVVEKWRRGKFSNTYFSDICRVQLLYEHGGLWLDATDFVTSPVPQYIMNEDFFLFMGGQKVRGWYAVIQSCFIRAKKGNPILDIWRKANFIYWENENSLIDYFQLHLLLCLSVEANETAKALFDKMPHIDQDPTHALWAKHCAEPYDETSFNQLTSDSFFQKTTYKDKRLKNLPHGSIAEHIINS